MRRIPSRMPCVIVANFTISITILLQCLHLNKNFPSLTLFELENGKKTEEVFFPPISQRSFYGVFNGRKWGDRTRKGTKEINVNGLWDDHSIQDTGTLKNVSVKLCRDPHLRHFEEAGCPSVRQPGNQKLSLTHTDTQHSETDLFQTLFVQLWPTPRCSSPVAAD